MEVFAAEYKTPTEVPLESDVLRVDYPKAFSPLLVASFQAFFACAGVAMVGLGSRSWVIGNHVSAVGLMTVGGLVAVFFVRRLVNEVTAWIRGVRGAYWLRLSTAGFEVNQGIFGLPRRYKWCEIEAFVVVGSHGRERVSFRFSPECHRFRPRRRTKPDGYVVGHWDRSPDEAVALMSEWLTRYRGA